MNEEEEEKEKEKKEKERRLYDAAHLLSSVVSKVSGDKTVVMVEKVQDRTTSRKATGDIATNERRKTSLSRLGFARRSRQREGGMPKDKDGARATATTRTERTRDTYDT